MSSVTFSTSVGGDGSTVTDDNNATTGLRDGGWKTRFVPALTQEVAVAGFVVTKANEASVSATASAASATSAAASYDSFDDRYLGAKTTNPTVDNDGLTLLVGAIYWNTTSALMRVWSGSAWIDYNPAIAYLALTGGTLTGAIGIGAAPSADTSIYVGDTLFSSSGVSRSFFAGAITPAATTTQSVSFSSFTRTLAASFVLSESSHFYANQGSIGVGSSITNQVAFSAESTLIGATNNYAFKGSIPSGTGRYNLYINGSASNYFSGNTGIGAITPATKLHVRTDGNSLNVLCLLQNRDAGAGVGSAIAFINSGNDFSDNRYSYIAAVTTGAGQNGNNLVFASNIDGQAAVERMRIDAVGSVGIGTTANTSAILDAQSTTKGVRFPNMTTTQKNAVVTPATGLVVFDTTLAKLCVYTGAAWQTITST